MILGAGNLSRRVGSACLWQRIKKLRLRSGERLGLTGPSGSDKTLLLHQLALLDAPERGWLQLKERERSSQGWGAC